MRWPWHTHFGGACYWRAGRTSKALTLLSVRLSRYLRTKASAAVFKYAGGLARRAFFTWSAHTLQQRAVRQRLGSALAAMGGLRKEMVFYG